MDNSMNKSTMAAAPPQYGTPPPQNPQNPQYNNPQFNPQYNPQFNPQFNPQYNPGQPQPYPPQPQPVYTQTVQPNPNVVLLQVPGGANPSQMCAEHGHIPVTSYGALGIFLAIFCFPIGIVALFMDRRTTCNRCGTILHGGL